MKERNLQTGRLGEDIARRYLENNGYQIVEQNYRTRYAEIDLIVRKDDILVFVEVRTKIGDKFGRPEESIDKNKIKRLIRNTLAYRAIRKLDTRFRIDAICIVLDEDRTPLSISHYENITL